MSNEGNPARREQTLVVVQTTQLRATYLVRSTDGSGRQYRKTHHVPQPIRDAADEHGQAYAMAYINPRSGRWHLTTMAEPPGAAAPTTPQGVTPCAL